MRLCPPALSSSPAKAGGPVFRVARDEPRRFEILDRPGKPGDDGCEGFGSELSQQRVAAGDFDLAGVRLEVELPDHAVVHQHRIAVRTDAETVAGGVEFHADRLGEFGVAVGEEY